MVWESGGANGPDAGDAGSVGNDDLAGVSGLAAGSEGSGLSGLTLPSDPNDKANPVGQRRVSLATSLLYSSGNFGSGIFYSFNNFLQYYFLAGVGAPPILYALLNSQRSFEGAVIQPVVGAWSDRTWNRFGRRRPFIIWFVPICVLFIVLTPFMPALGGIGHIVGISRGLTVLVLVSITIFLFSLTFNVMYDPYNALLADITPARQRGSVNGVFQAVGAAGQVGILLAAFVLGVPTVALYLIVAAALIIFFVPTLLGVREPRHLVGVVPHRRYTVRDYWNGLKADRQVQLYFAVQFFLWFGINAITPFLVPYALDVLHFSKEEATLLPLVLLLASSVFVLPWGLLSDRIGLKRMFLIGMMAMAGASVAGIFTHNHLLLYIILAIAGLGNAAQTASSYPLLTRLVFPDQMGLYTGLNSTVTSIAAPLSGLIAGALVSIPTIGFKAMFPFVAVMFLLSLIPLALLRMDKSMVVTAQREAASELIETAAPAQ